jgi:hypothetical protein
MNIEISPKEYWRELNPADGKLYCSMVVIDGKNDWRPMSFMEKLKNIHYLEGNRAAHNPSLSLSLSIPVRDL